MSLQSILKQADIFAELTTTQLELVASICAAHTFNRNDIIVEENTSGDLAMKIRNTDLMMREQLTWAKNPKSDH